jgi:hypothetical protein
MTLFLEIPLLLCLVALQASAVRRASRFWSVMRVALTGAALVAIPWLLYLRASIEQPTRVIVTPGGVKLIKLGSSAYIAGAIRNSLTLAIAASILIAAYGFAGMLLREQAAHQLAVLEIAAWLAFLIITGLLTLLVIALAGVNFH